MVQAHSLVVAWQSQQAVGNHLLAEAHSQAGLAVQILDRELFVSGAARHKIRAATRHPRGDEGPAIFHINFTGGKDEKLSGLKGLGLWFVPEDCPLETLLSDAAAAARCFVRATGAELRVEG